jgi:hypothetical protein
MKTLLSLLFAVLLTVSVSAQNCSPIVTVNCDWTITVEIPANSAITVYGVYLAGGAYGTGTLLANVTAAPSGNTFYTSTVTISDTAGYSVTVAQFTAYPNATLYPCTSTYLRRFLSVFGVVSVPELGWKYQNATAATQVLFCASPSPSGNVGNGNNGNGKGRGNGN